MLSEFPQQGDSGAEGGTHDRILEAPFRVCKEGVCFGPLVASGLALLGGSSQKYDRKKQWPLTDPLFMPLALF